MRKLVLASASVLAVATWSTTAVAQDQANEEEQVAGDAADDENTIVVVGSFQRALADAFDEKRNANQVVDVVASEDLGKLPDISIAEAIARLPGVVANRDRGNATELSVRGLGPNLTSTLLNGREIATGESSRNIRFETYPAELLNGAYVFKSPTAGLVEGGVGGTIDLRTIKPLDLGETRFVVNARASYFDLADDIADSNAFGYTGSISYVDQFFDDTLGIVLAVALRDQPIASARTNLFPATPRQEFGNSNTAAFDAAGIEQLPFGYEGLIRGGEDTRNGVVAAIQWQPSSAFELNADFFYSGVDFVEEQRGFRFNFGDNVGAIEFGNQFTDVVGSDGSIVSATVSPTAGFGGHIRTVNEQFTLFDDTYAGGLNLAWSSGNLTVTGDVGYSKTDRESQFISVETEVHDVTGTPFEVTNGLSGSFARSAGSPTAIGFNFDLSDPSINLPSIVRAPTADTIDDEIVTYALDLEYEFNGGFLSSVGAGIRYSDRAKSLLARSAFPFINPGDRTAVPEGLLGAPLRGAGNVSFPATLTFDRDAVITQLFGGVDPQQANFNTTESWVVEEDLLAGYVVANFEGNLGSLPFSGNIGGRLARTEIVSSSTFLENGAGTGFVEVLTPFSVSNEYTDFLPSLNVAFFPAENHIVRVALSKALSRAPLDDLSAGVGEFNFGQPEAFGGNPLLEPFRTSQVDLTYEWYFEGEGAFTISGFYKDIETFIVRETRTGVELPSGDIGNFTQPINGEGGRILGVEVAYSQPFTFLPEPLDGFGLYLNYTYVDSNIEVGPAFVAGTFPLPGLAENTFNAQLWYYKSGFEARLGYRYNDAFATELGDVPDQVLFSDSAEVVDFQMSYEFPERSGLDGLKLLFQANNLTDEPFETYYGVPAARGRYEEFGTRYWFGFSYSF